MTSTFPSLATTHIGPYDLATLQTWTQRPQAVTKCFVQDVYSLKALIPGQVHAGDYLGRGRFDARLPNVFMLMEDVYLLDHWPCRMVELVAWVAGAEDKEKTMLITGPSLSRWTISC